MRSNCIVMCVNRCCHFWSSDIAHFAYSNKNSGRISIRYSMHISNGIKSVMNVSPPSRGAFVSIKCITSCRMSLVKMPLDRNAWTEMNPKNGNYCYFFALFKHFFRENRYFEQFLRLQFPKEIKLNKFQRKSRMKYDKSERTCNFKTTTIAFRLFSLFPSISPLFALQFEMHLPDASKSAIGGMQSKNDGLCAKNSIGILVNLISCCRFLSSLLALLCPPPSVWYFVSSIIEFFPPQFALCATWCE